MLLLKKERKEWEKNRGKERQGTLPRVTQSNKYKLVNMNSHSESLSSTVSSARSEAAKLDNAQTPALS